MQLPDTNVLLLAVNPDSPCREVAQRSLNEAVQHPQGMGLTWIGLVAFIRLTTRAPVLREPLPVDTALRVVQGWLDHPAVQLLQPGPRHMDILSRLLLAAGRAGNLTNDAHIAAIAIEHNAEVLTFDRDFAKFTGLRYQLLS